MIDDFKVIYFSNTFTLWNDFGEFVVITCLINS